MISHLSVQNQQKDIGFFIDKCSLLAFFYIYLHFHYLWQNAIHIIIVKIPHGCQEIRIND